MTQQTLMDFACVLRQEPSYIRHPPNRPHKYFISCFLCQQTDMPWVAHTCSLKSWILPIEMGLFFKKHNICKTKNVCPICSEVPKQRDRLSKTDQKEKTSSEYGSIVERI